MKLDLKLYHILERSQGLGLTLLLWDSTPQLRGYSEATYIEFELASFLEFTAKTMLCSLDVAMIMSEEFEIDVCTED